jgi:hypothetical protein
MGADHEPAMDDSGLTETQEAGVRRARSVIRRRAGVIIADRVGAGKTHMAAALIGEARAEGAVLVVAPAVLLGHWRSVLRGTGVLFASHTRLSRGDAPGGPPQLVVVDEAHAFRNPQTRRYRTLARLCAGAKVLLLTATPINNSLLDLYFLIRLFAGDGAFRDLGVAHLADVFRLAALSPDQPPSPGLGAVLREVVIRRVELSAPVEGLGFPVRSTVAVDYSLVAGYRGGLAKTLRLLESLDLTPYRAGHGGRESSAAELIRLLLLKRLESSRAAFGASIRAVLRVTESFLDAAREGRLLLPRDQAAFRGADGLQLLLTPLVAPVARRSISLDDLIRGAGRDLALLNAIEPIALSDGSDPKLLALRGLLEGPLARRKVLLFSEFRETARWLWRALRGGLRVALIDGEGAFLGAGAAGRMEVIRLFAPRANRAPVPPPSRAVDLLIATDVLAEGLNLQDAEAVISFDLPWNPVRLVQRIGRIDRLGSPHERITCYTFIPDEGLEDVLRVLARLRIKLDAIRLGLGAEESVLGSTPGVEEVIRRIRQGDAADLLRGAGPWSGPDALETLQRRVRCEDIQSDELAVPVAEAPSGFGPPGSLIAILRHPGARPCGLVLSAAGVAALDESTLAALLSQALGRAEPPTGPMDTARVAAAIEPILAARSDLAGPARNTVAGQAARRLMRMLADAGPAADDATCRRVDRLLARLGPGLRAGEDLAVRDWLRSAGGVHLAVALADLELRLGSEGPSEVVLLAVFGCGPPSSLSVS